MDSKSYVGWMKYYVGMPIPIHQIIKSYLVQHSNSTFNADVIEKLSLQITETIESYFKDNRVEDCVERIVTGLDDYPKYN
jgi:hypothetical protein